MFSFALSGTLYHMICHGTLSKNTLVTIGGVTHMCGAVSGKSNAVTNEFGAFFIVAAGHKAKKYFVILCQLYHG